ncbi:MAG: recombination protein RecR [Candidatus Cloacimonadota bacterium]|nr:MAG: recombination protein RecR [Candidatus Cloacimonadota bacterium]
MLTGSLLTLQENLKKLPGIGAKSARRLALHLIGSRRNQAIDLANAIINAAESYSNCSVCNCLTESDPCNYCADAKRDSQVLCVVQNSADLFHIEKTGQYRGRYFVLGQLLSPIEGIGPMQIHFNELVLNIKNNNVRELILALNPTVEGESTIRFLADQLTEKVEKISRLSTGLPFGGDLEYAGDLTLQDAFKRRYSATENE